MRKVLIMILFGLAVSPAGLAQDDAGKVDEAAAKELKPSKKGARLAPEGGVDPLERFAETLGLTDKQRGPFEKSRLEMEKQLTQLAEYSEKMAGMRAQLEQGKANDDWDAIKNARAGISEIQTEVSKVVDEFVNQIRDSLTESQAQRLDVARLRLESRLVGEPDPLDDAEAVLQRLKVEGKLNKGQIHELDGVLQGFSSLAETDRTRELVQKLYSARQSGEPETAAGVEEELLRMREEQQVQIDELYARVDTLLVPDQREKFATLRGGPTAAALRQSDPLDVRTIIRAARRLNLTQPQKDFLDELTRQAMRMSRDAGRDRQARTAVAEQVKNEIRSVLTADQVRQFEQLLPRAAGAPSAGKSAKPVAPSAPAKPDAVTGEPAGKKDEPQGKAGEQAGRPKDE